MLAICLISLTACASSEPYEHEREPSASEAAKLLGCHSDEVAMCIEDTCEPEDWYCASRGEMRDILESGEDNR